MAEPKPTHYPPKVPVFGLSMYKPSPSCYTIPMTAELVPTPSTADRLLRAICLRIEGHSFQDIARQLNYPSARILAKAVSTAVTKITVESPEGIRSLELLRLDQLLAKLWPWAMGFYKKPIFDDQNEFTNQYTEFEGPPDYKAIDRILALMKRRADLAGLDAPKQSERNITVNQPKKKPADSSPEDLSALMTILMNSGALELPEPDPETTIEVLEPPVGLPGPRLLPRLE